MAKLDRYIARHVLAAMLVVLLVLGGLDLLFTAVDELGESEGNYDTAQVIRYLMLTAPHRLYELLPVTALIGALAGLGIAYVFEPLAREAIREERLQWLLPDTAIEEPGLFAYYPRRASEAPKVRAFVAAARDLAGRQGD